MLAVFLGVRLWNPAVAVIAALAAGWRWPSGWGWRSGLRWCCPGRSNLRRADFDAGVIVGLALRCICVTMASQNLPGFATMRAAGYEPRCAVRWG